MVKMSSREDFQDRDKLWLFFLFFPLSTRWTLCLLNEIKSKTNTIRLRNQRYSLHIRNLSVGFDVFAVQRREIPHRSIKLRSQDPLRTPPEESSTFFSSSSSLLRRYRLVSHLIAVRQEPVWRKKTKKGGNNSWEIPPYTHTHTQAITTTTTTTKALAIYSLNPNNEDWGDTEAVILKISCGLSALHLPQLQLDLYQSKSQTSFEAFQETKSQQTDKNTSEKKIHCW